MMQKNIASSIHRSWEEGLPQHSRVGKQKPILRPQDEQRLFDSSQVRTPGKNLSTKTPQRLRHDLQPSSPRFLKHRSRRIGTWPDPPPTPPNYAKLSSDMQPAIPSSPTIPLELIRPVKLSASHGTPATPPDQRSPPTPDVTPPQVTTRSKDPRSVAADRNAPKSPPTESRSESFKTAREDPTSSGDEHSPMTVKLSKSSASTSQTTVHLIPASGKILEIQPEDLNHHEPFDRATVDEEPYTPRTQQVFRQFDGNWARSKDVADQAEDDASASFHSQRNTTTRVSRAETDRRAPKVIQGKVDTPPTKSATERVPKKVYIDQERRQRHCATTSDRGTQTAWVRISSSPPQHERRSSGTSANSRSSTIIEAYLFDERPKRQQTLRHIRKQQGLRSPIGSPLSSHVPFQLPNSPSLKLSEHERPQNCDSTDLRSVSGSDFGRDTEVNQEGPTVTKSRRPLSIQRELDRDVSARSIPSLRSGKTVSLASIPFDDSVFPDDEDEDVNDTGSVKVSGRRPRRRLSQTDPSDIRTIDYPPAVPRRSSSLSAPTSRNHSRTNSLTGDDGGARGFLQPRSKYPPLANSALHSREPSDLGTTTPHLAPAPVFNSSPRIVSTLTSDPDPEASLLSRLHQEDLDQSPLSSPINRDLSSEKRFSFEHNDEILSTRKYSSRNTPFSIASFDTSWTAPEISEAQAVQMYHQKPSVVNHSNKGSEASDSPYRDVTSSTKTDGHTLNPTGTAGDLPVTPAESQEVTDIDSPLRNPRSPPEPPFGPPALNFIAATPSGTTPIPDRIVQMGNFYSVTSDKAPRKPSLIRRAFSRGRNPVSYPPQAGRPPGFLARTFSRSRSRRRSYGDGRQRPSTEPRPTYPQGDDFPVQENRLHPYWKAQQPAETVYSGRDGMTYRYPLIDNRPGPPRRNLSAKMKQTFAILPIRHDVIDPSDTDMEPQFLKMKRSSDGQLRAKRNSFSSISREYDPSQVPGSNVVGPETPRAFWGGHSSQAQPFRGRRRRSSIEHAVEGLQNLPRRFSEKRREKRTRELRAKISAPTAVHDGIEDLIRPTGYRNVQDGISQI